MSDSRGDAAQDEARRRQLKQKIQRQLDEALEDSFPASDPVSIVTSHEEEDWGNGLPGDELPENDSVGREPAGSPPDPGSPKTPLRGQ
jgi:hypothetical protein